MTRTADTFGQALDRERAALAEATQRGIGMPAAGMLYWLAVTWLIRIEPLPLAMLHSFFLTGLVFPIGVALTRFGGGDVFAKRPGLTQLGVLLAGLQLFYWPVIVVIYNIAPAWTPWTMAVLFGAHFLPYAWLYRSKAYAFLTVSLTLSLCALVIAARAPEPAAVPMVAAVCYFAAVVWLWIENRAPARVR